MFETMSKLMIPTAGIATATAGLGPVSPRTPTTPRGTHAISSFGISALVSASAGAGTAVGTGGRKVPAFFANAQLRDESEQKKEEDKDSEEDKP